DQPPLGVDDADRVVLVLVDQGTVGRAGDVQLDLLGDGQQAMADDLRGDRIDVGGPGGQAAWLVRGVHRLAPGWSKRICSSPRRPTLKRSSGPTRVVEPYSSMTAGPWA